MKRKRVAILGSTGSIGTQALDVIARFPDRFEVVGLAAGRNVELLREQAERFACAIATSAQEDPRSLHRVAVESNPDVVLAATDGAVAFDAVFAAVERGTDVAVANKELIVAAGELLSASAKRSGAQLLPVDSEHSAIWQCLRGERAESVRRLILTASGGALRSLPLAELSQVSPDQALAHPNWRMGPKVTIDTATMINKGLEVIEAHFLFDIPYERIDVVIHPQSAIHSAVEFCDGTMIAQLGIADMRAPIALALSDGVRLPGVVAPLQLEELGHLDFEAVDPNRYPALKVVRDAGLRGGAVPAVMNAANEVVVAAFLEGKIRFTEISTLVERVTGSFEPTESLGLEQLLAADRWARARARALVGQPSVPTPGAVPV